MQPIPRRRLQVLIGAVRGDNRPRSRELPRGEDRGRRPERPPDHVDRPSRALALENRPPRRRRAGRRAKSFASPLESPTARTVIASTVKRAWPAIASSAARRRGSRPARGSEDARLQRIAANEPLPISWPSHVGKRWRPHRPGKLGKALGPQRVRAASKPPDATTCPTSPATRLVRSQIASRLRQASFFNMPLPIPWDSPTR